MEINEGTIQGCAMSTGVYDIGVSPLVKEMHTEAIVQIWQVDDASASGDPIPLHGWFQKLRERASNYGYNIKKGKCYLVTKDDKAKQIFKKELDDGTLILADGARYLGAPLGSEGFKRNFFKERMSTINKKITKL